MTDKPVRIIRHSIILDSGSFEVRFADGRESKYFYWDDNAGRRAVNMHPTQAQALEDAKTFARSQ